jgi:hypothetical protein
MATLPILFDGKMVCAILDGRKTQTRRPVKLYEGFTPRSVEYVGETKLDTIFGSDVFIFSTELKDVMPARQTRIDPAYRKDDVLYVRETFKLGGMFTDAVRIVYQATEHRAWSETMESFPVELAKKQGYSTSTTTPAKYIPSIHMPRWCSRLFLKVTNVRCERLKATTLNDARCEGFVSPKQFFNAWEKRYPQHGENPFVWVYEFERCDRPSDFVKPLWEN